MPNYYGKVRCGYCGETGHNRRGCSRLTKAIQDRYDESVAGNNTPHAEHWGRELAKRTGTNPHTGETKVKRRREYGRQCSYCRGNSHNRRKCPQMVIDRKRLTDVTATMRQALLKLLRASGCVPGAMVTKQPQAWNSESTFPALILGIDWDLIDAKSIRRGIGALHALKACRMDTGMKINIELPCEIMGTTPGRTSTRLASPAHNIELAPPAGWLDGENINFEDTGLFDKGERRDYWFWEDLQENVDAWVQQAESHLSGQVNES